MSERKERRRAQSSKKKKEKAKEVLVKVEQRKGKKMTTIVLGLDLFGIKPADAAKVFKKKMACGCGVSKNAENREEVEIQVSSVCRRGGAGSAMAWARCPFGSRGDAL